MAYVAEKSPVVLGTLYAYEGLHRKQISFPLGGIGTGCVGLSGYGGLKDWEIFNRPNIGGSLPYTFPIIYAKEKGKEPVCRIVMAHEDPPYGGDGMGNPHLNGEGFPHMDDCVFRGEYPFARIDFRSNTLPVKVTLEAYNPYIPNDEEASGYPAAILHYYLTNRCKAAVDIALAWSVFNPIGMVGVAENMPGKEEIEFGLGKNENLVVHKGNLVGLEFISHQWPKDHPRFGSLAVTTPNRGAIGAPYWKRAAWFTAKHDFWDTFSQTGKLPMHEYGPTEEGQSCAGAVGVSCKINPRETKKVTFYFTWYFPNFEKYWHCGSDSCCKKSTERKNKPVWKNYYASKYDSALDVAIKLHAKEKQLYHRNRTFHNDLITSTLPEPLLEAVSSQISILKTPTVLRLSDGSFYGFEGCTNGWGCCEGSCTHVWNYQQALPYLFPRLERSMRENDYRYNMRDDGSMCFRLQLPLGAPPDTFHACTDGQMGGIIKALRDWRICGDETWIRRLWPKLKMALEYAWKQWDSEKIGLMTGIQHNTYDIEFHGPNPYSMGFYLGALRAAEEMACVLGEPMKAMEYRQVFESGRKKVEDLLYNGEYYIQIYNPDQTPDYQFGTGCLSDQLLGQWLASFAGIGYVFTPSRIQKTLRSIFKYNWKDTVSDHANAQRVYALGNEPGLVLCTWPKGNRLKVPFPYSDEVWTGSEYQVASHCFMEGLLREGLTIVQGVRARHDGFKRNPWDEFECGHHYARALAAFGLLVAISGFTCDMRIGMIGFAPKINKKSFACFWSLDGAWGIYRELPNKVVLEVREGKLKLRMLQLDSYREYSSAIIRHKGRRINLEKPEKNIFLLPHDINVHAGSALTLLFTM